MPAVCVHLTILAVYLIGRRSIGERAAFWAALLLSVAPGFVSVARLLLLDGLLTLCVTVSVLCGFEAVRTGRFKPGWWLAAALASGFGFLTKGPISEVLLFVPLWVYAFLASEPHPCPLPEGRGQASEARGARVRWYWYALFFAIVVAVNVPWYVAMYREQPQFLGHFFWQHNVMRFLQPFDHLQPIWYYVPILLGGLLPGTILLGGVPVATGRSRRRHTECACDCPAGGFWLLAGAWCVFFFSCSGSKLPTYILPAYPFLCLALGEFVARTRWNSRGLDARDGRRDGRARAVRPSLRGCRGTRRSGRRSAGRNSSSGSWTTRRRRWCASRGTATRWRSTRTAPTCETSARRT